MRDPNYDDARLALQLYDLRRETEMRKARSMIGREVAFAPWEKVAALFEYDHPENAHLRQATGYWEMAASFVLRGILHPAVYLDTCGEGLFTLITFKPHLVQIRKDRPQFLVKTEQLAHEIPPIRERVANLEAMMAKWQADRAARQPARKRKPAKTAAPGKKKRKKRAR